MRFPRCSYSIKEVERVSHRVAVMYLGEIVEIGPRAAVFGNPQHAYTKRLISAVPNPNPDRRREKGKISNDEIKSPMRPADFQVVPIQYREVPPGHLVAKSDHSTQSSHLG